jgi:hypothetical protein
MLASAQIPVCTGYVLKNGKIWSSADGTATLIITVTPIIIIIIIINTNIVQVIPIVISTTGIIPKSLSQSLKRQLASKYIHTNAKYVIFGTCLIVRNFLNYK